MIKIAVHFDDAYRSDNLWFQRSKDCPQIAERPQIACCMGQFKKELNEHGCWTGEAVRDDPVAICDFRHPTFTEGDSIRGCHYDEGKRVTFGKIEVKHAPPRGE